MRTPVDVILKKPDKLKLEHPIISNGNKLEKLSYNDRLKLLKIMPRQNDKPVPWNPWVENDNYNYIQTDRSW